jgi:hypothetical protein
MDLSRAQIIAFEIDGYGPDLYNRFPENVGRRARSEKYPAYIRRMVALNIYKVLTKDDYYTLDDHLRARGQEAVATEVIRAMGVEKQ